MNLDLINPTMNFSNTSSNRGLGSSAPPYQATAECITQSGTLLIRTDNGQGTWRSVEEAVNASDFTYLCVDPANMRYSHDVIKAIVEKAVKTDELVVLVLEDITGLGADLTEGIRQVLTNPSYMLRIKAVVAIEYNW
jgi:hypothetical protein